MLSKTQRKTPTVCHRGWAIARLRDFYARKIKFTSENFCERLQRIGTDFPQLNNIHPYYSNLINVLYSQDHYRLALAQVSTAKTLIDKIAKDTLHLMKFAETQYRCKSLKRAALGRMVTLIKKLNASLGYLESVRRHMSRLPAIDPTTRTLMVTGFPNVGKSSFINRVSKANVEEQPYAFTTKSIFVGHFDYMDQRWQVIDTPGLLDRPLKARNTIEMQAITALAHLNACVLFFVDVSEGCEYSIKDQAALYTSIRPLFANKPLLVVANKVDLRPLDQLDEEDTALIQAIARNTQVLPMSNVTLEGVSKVKSAACSLYMQHATENNMQSGRVHRITNQLQISMPIPRDNKQRPAHIPDQVREQREEAKAARALLEENMKSQGFDEDAIDSQWTSSVREGKKKRRTLKTLEDEAGGPGFFNFDRRSYFDLKEEDWKYDAIPEIMDGKNVADFFHADIEAHLDALEKEEEELQAAFEASGIMLAEDQEVLTEEQYAQLEKIRAKKALIQDEANLKQSKGSARMPRTVLPGTMEDAERKLGEIGLDTTKMMESLAPKAAAREASRARARKRARDDEDQDIGREDVDIDDMEEAAARQRARSLSRMRSSSHARSQSRMRGQAPEEGDGFKDATQKKKAEKLETRLQRKMAQEARKGEADRHVYDLKPKHLYSGKRGIGKTDWR